MAGTGFGAYAAAMATPHHRADSRLVSIASRRVASSAAGSTSRQQASPSKRANRSRASWPSKARP